MLVTRYFYIEEGDRLGTIRITSQDELINTETHGFIEKHELKKAILFTQETLNEDVRQYEIRVCAESAARMIPDWYNLQETEDVKALRPKQIYALKVYAEMLGCWGLGFDYEVQEAFTRIFGYMTGSRQWPIEIIKEERESIEL